MHCENCGSQIPNGINYCYNCKNSLIKNVSNKQDFQQQSFISTFSKTMSEDERNLAVKKLKLTSSALVFSVFLSFVLPIVSLIIITRSMCTIKSLCISSALDITYKAKKLRSRATVLIIFACFILLLQILFFAVFVILHFLIQYFPDLYNFVLEHEEFFSMFLFLI